MFLASIYYKLSKKNINNAIMKHKTIDNCATLTLSSQNTSSYWNLLNNIK